MERGRGGEEGKEEKENGVREEEGRQGRVIGPHKRWLGPPLKCGCSQAPVAGYMPTDRVYIPLIATSFTSMATARMSDKRQVERCTLGYVSCVAVWRVIGSLYGPTPLFQIMYLSINRHGDADGCRRIAAETELHGCLC